MFRFPLVFPLPPNVFPLPLVFPLPPPRLYCPLLFPFPELVPPKVPPSVFADDVLEVPPESVPADPEPRVVEKVFAVPLVAP
jgi:hypothetical protein